MFATDFRRSSREEFHQLESSPDQFKNLISDDSVPKEIALTAHPLIQFTKLWQSCSDPHLKIRPIAIFTFYSLNYSLAARLQDNSRPRSFTKVERKRKLQQFTVSGMLMMNGEESGSEKKETLRLKLHSVLSVSTITSLCLHESLFSYVIDFSLTDAHPKFVYKLDINNHKAVLNERDKNNLFN